MSHDPKPTTAGALDRRTLLTSLAAGAATAALPHGSSAEQESCRPAGTLPNVVVISQHGARALFVDDLLARRVVLLHFTSEEAERTYPVLDHLARVQDALGARMGREVLLLSIVTDALPAPAPASPRRLAELAKRHGAGPGWLFLSAEPAALDALRSRFFETGHAHGAGDDGDGEDCSRGLLRYGNAALGLWGSVPARAEPASIAARLAWVMAAPVTSGRSESPRPPRRKGPLPLALALALALAGGSTRAQQSCVGHPYPQPFLAASTQTTTGDTTVVSTGASLFPASRPFVDPPGTNLLPNVYTNSFDSSCNEIPNTLPSTPTVPYNLHDGDPVVTRINPISPTNDLEASLDRLEALATARQRSAFEVGAARQTIDFVIDILEGNPVPNRSYSGFPLLHYTGPDKVKSVAPTYDAQGKVTGGNVDIHQIWYDNHIEADTALVDPTVVRDVPWTITYTLDVLDRGKDDFSPFVMYFDAPTASGAFGPINVGMDQTFFPIEEGTRTVLRLKMAPAKYFSLSYTWGWRWHPPRVQVTDNATKVVAGKALPEWEISVFGPNPRASEQAKLAAIGKLADLAPAKVMWNAMRAARAAIDRGDWAGLAEQTAEARLAFEDWQDRTRLPRGVPLDPAADLTLAYLNNTLYGQFTDGGTINFPKWQTRGTTLAVTMWNGDYFDHRYLNADFGSGRGWENQFKSSVRVGGSGCWFTFGRNYINFNVATPIVVPAATQSAYQPDRLGRHKLLLTFNVDPSRRLRFYQFDPTHHDVAVFSVH